MTSSIIQDSGLTFAQIVSRSPSQRIEGYNYHLSNGASFCTSTLLPKDSWNFFDMQRPSGILEGMQYWTVKSVYPVSDDMAKEFDLKLRNLQQLSDKLVAKWTILNHSERDMVLSQASTLISGAAATGFAIDFIGGIIAEGVAGVATGGLSLIASGAFAFMSAMSYEKTQQLTERFTTALCEYEEAAEGFAYFMKALLPAEYHNRAIVDPAFKSIATRMRYVLQGITQNDIIMGLTDKTKVAFNKLSTFCPAQPVSDLGYGVA